MTNKEVLAAHVAGEEIQYRGRSGITWFSKVDFSVWNFIDYEYRVKPKEPEVIYGWEGVDGTLGGTFKQNLKALIDHYANCDGKVVKFVEEV